MQTKPRFAPIVPPGMVFWVNQKRLIPNYSLLLVQDVLKHPGVYREFEGTVGPNLKEQRVVILDNGVVETGQAADFGAMREAIDICKPTHVAIPDVMGDYRETVNAALKASKQYERLLPEGISLMGIPQGKTSQEVEECATRLYELVLGIRLWGVPRLIANNLGTRAHTLMFLKRRFPNIPIHMLGFSNHLLDDISCARSMDVLGIDSSMPCAWGLKGTYISLDEPPERVKLADVGWEDPDVINQMTSINGSILHDTVEWNIQRVHRWLQEG